MINNVRCKAQKRYVSQVYAGLFFHLSTRCLQAPTFTRWSGQQRTSSHAITCSLLTCPSFFLPQHCRYSVYITFIFRPKHIPCFITLWLTTLSGGSVCVQTNRRAPSKGIVSSSFSTRPFLSNVFAAK